MNTQNTTTQNTWRNFGIIAHIDAGKTTLTERILLETGSIHKAGEVHDGAATTDHMELERERGITIGAAAITSAHTFKDRSYRLTLIDTPGHVDFAVEVERSLRVLDGAVAVFCAVGGVQPQSETVWRQADKYALPRIAFVNKLDRQGADFEAVLSQMRERLGASVLPVVVPYTKDGAAVSLIDLINEEEIPFKEQGEGQSLPWSDTVRALFAPRRLEMIECLAGHDERLENMWLREETILVSDIEDALARATQNQKVVPVFSGSAFKNRGVKKLLDGVCAILPAPKPSLSSEPVGFVFKTENTGHGKMAFVRMYEGSLAVGDQIFNPRKNESVKIGRLARVQADSLDAIEKAVAGEIVAVLNAKDMATGDTLTSKTSGVCLENLQLQDPVLAWKIVPKQKNDNQKLVEALLQATVDDPSLRFTKDTETGDALLWGMGELHLDVTVERLRRERGLELLLGEPSVAYRETPSFACEGWGVVDKQTGGKGQYAKVLVKIEPGENNSVENNTSGGVITSSFASAATRGILDALSSGPLGYPVVGVRVSIMDGAMHSVDSSEQAFYRAGYQAVKDNLKSTTQLEPIMSLVIDTPSEYLGDVLGDVLKRSGKTLAIKENQSGSQVVAEVPLASLSAYTTTLRSLTKGRAVASQTFGRYEASSTPDRKPKVM